MSRSNNPPSLCYMYYIKNNCVTFPLTKVIWRGSFVLLADIKSGLDDGVYYIRAPDCINRVVPKWWNDLYFCERACSKSSIFGNAMLSQGLAGYGVVIIPARDWDFRAAIYHIGPAILVVYGPYLRMRAGGKNHRNPKTWYRWSNLGN